MNKELFKKREVGEYSSHQAIIPTKSGNFYLSVVAGHSLYSYPREYRENCDYTEVEVAIFNKNTNEFASYNEAKPAFDIIGKGEYEERNVDKEQFSVFGYVDINLIDKLIEVL